jgi:hypothetical protein
VKSKIAKSIQVEYFELKQKLHKRMEEHLSRVIPIHKNNNIAEAITLYETGQFNHGNAISIAQWAYQFHDKWDVSI